MWALTFKARTAGKCGCPRLSLSLRCLSSLIISIWLTGDRAFLFWTDLLQNLSDGIYLKSWCFHPFTFTSACIQTCGTQWFPFPHEGTFSRPSKLDIWNGLGFLHPLLGHLCKGINMWQSWVFFVLFPLSEPVKIHFKKDRVTKEFLLWSVAIKVNGTHNNRITQ